MRKEKEMFDVAFKFLELHYNDKNLESVAQELPAIFSRFKGSGLYQNLILAVVAHLEAKLLYEQGRAGK